MAGCRREDALSTNTGWALIDYFSYHDEMFLLGLDRPLRVNEGTQRYTKTICLICKKKDAAK